MSHRSATLNTFFSFSATAFVVTCMTTLISQYGKHDQKGTVLGIFRSLGALARAVGPTVASICKTISFHSTSSVSINFHFDFVAFWWIGSTATYVAGGLLLLIPAVQLQHLKLVKAEKQQ